MRIVLLNTFCVRGLIVVVCFLYSESVFSQSGDATVAALVQLGFENVRWTEDEQERIYVIENNTYSQTGVGLGKAIDQIQLTGLPDGDKPCSLIVLEQNIPLIACNLERTSRAASRSDWQIRYDLGDSWDKVKRVKAQNRSFFKPDLVLYPEFMWRNIRLDVMYEVVLAFSPVVEVSAWPGMKFGFQLFVPIVNGFAERYNENGVSYNKVRPGMITLSQKIRLPGRIFLKATVGTFRSFRWGVDLRARHLTSDGRWRFDARMGYTVNGWYEGWVMDYGTEWKLTGSLGATYYWSRYNTTLTLRGERYLYGEYGVRADLMRHFRHASVGFYMMKVQDPQVAGMPAPHQEGLNGGFMIQIDLPPYKMKRKGYLPRIKGGSPWIRYNAATEPYYGQSYQASIDDDYRNDIKYNPYFIKSELLNY